MKLNKDGYEAETVQSLGAVHPPLRDLDPHTPGAKLDAGKPRLGLVLGDFARALRAVGEVGTLGAAKYSDRGWLQVPNAHARYTDAALRHFFAHATGERHDPELGTLHLANLAWNCLAVLELTLREQAPPEDHYP